VSVLTSRRDLDSTLPSFDGTVTIHKLLLDGELLYVFSKSLASLPPYSRPLAYITSHIFLLLYMPFCDFRSGLSRM